MKRYITIADKIRSLNDEELAKFIWWFSINQISCFFVGEYEKPKKAMNYREIRDYLSNDIENWIDFSPEGEK